MKSCLFPAALLLLSAAQTNAFVGPSHSLAAKTSAASSSVLFAIELEPEPEGGEELTAVKTMDGSRMKKMEEAEGVSSDDGTAYKFWLSANVEGALVKEIHTEVLKQSAKNANFPGFRKGQVPPFAMPQIRGFAVQESIVRTCQSAVDAYGLKSLSGSDGEVEVLEDIPALAEKYKLGDDLQFTATFNAVYDPANAPAASSDDGAIDVEAETAEAAE
ncbi:MAG: hypothetical protein SGILL_007278 [Bacillariaceae sp.]